MVVRRAPLNRSGQASVFLNGVKVGEQFRARILETPTIWASGSSPLRFTE